MTFPKSIKRALNYNENKCKQGRATCIAAAGFLKDADRLHFYDKLVRFENQNSLNKRSKTNTLHISLNFHPKEKMDERNLIKIAETYMQEIGFGQQPYLVYRHSDAGHPHIHIVTTSIKFDGKRISLHNLGRNESDNARKKIEVEFGLMKAETAKLNTSDHRHALLPQKIIAGKSETKRSITSVLDYVLREYKFSSLAELNAVLSTYHVIADRGKEDGIIYKTGGLLYHQIDLQGKKIGVPIKASSIYSKPTLALLKMKFQNNLSHKESFKKQTASRIDWVLLNKPKTLKDFGSALFKEHITLIPRINNDGMIYGLTYIDHNTKCVFNGSTLGKQYAANSITKLFEPEKPALKINKGISENEPHLYNQQFSEVDSTQKHSLIDEIVSPEKDFSNIPSQLKRKRRKKNKQKN